MKTLLRWMRLAVLWSLAGPLLAQESSWPEMTQPLPAVPGVKVEILPLPTTVEGSYAKLLESLSQQAEPLMALLFYPEAGINQYSPGILFLHGGLGGHPARQVGAPRYAAERLAARGYTVLSIYSRHSRHYRTVRFEEFGA